MTARSKKSVAKISNTQGAPSAESAAPVAGPDPIEGASSSTIVGSDAPGVQTTDTGKVADAGVTVPASATTNDGQFSEGLPPTGTGPETAKPEPTPVEGGASSSSSEASIASTPATETGQATGDGEAGAPPVADTADQTSDAEALRKRISTALGELETGTIRITSRIEGFRRAGMRHSKTPTDHPVDTFTSEQLDQLDDEPILKVEYL